MKRKLQFQQQKRRKWPSNGGSRAKTRIKKPGLKAAKADPKVIIVLEGGVLQVVYSNVPIKYALVDYDKEIPIEESYLRGVFPSEVINDLASLYDLTDEELLGLPDAYAKIYTGLRAEGF